METLLQAWLKAHRPVTSELYTTLPIVEGSLPIDLRGVLVRNGPGRFGIGESHYGHLFDGDGLVLRFAIGATSSDSRPVIRYRNRYVRTHEFISEERAGHALYRGFGTNLPGGMLGNFFRLRLKNAANTNIVYHGGRLYALWEGGLPHVLDPVTLDTITRTDFSGALRNRGSFLDRQLSPYFPFSAHPKIDDESGCLYNFGVVNGKEKRLLSYRVDRAGQLEIIAATTLPHEAFVHDFCLTPNWMVHFIHPMSFDKARVLLGLSTLADTFAQVKDRPTLVLMLPRGAGQPRWFSAPPCFIFHYANAYENEAGQVVIDACRVDEYPEFPPLDEALAGAGFLYPRPRLVRYTLDPKQPDYSRPEEQLLLDEPSIEMPRVHPGVEGRRHRYVYGIGSPGGTPRNLFTALLRKDVETGETLCRDFSPGLVSEPIFAPRLPAATGSPSDAGHAETDGYILSVVYRDSDDRSALYVLDARDLSTVCVALLPHHVPPGFHGNFIAAADCPPGWQA